jgi:hypothetical protein
MISDDFLAKTSLNEEEARALAMLLAILVSQNSEMALQAAKQLGSLTLQSVQINREGIEKFKIILERINNSFHISFSLPVTRLLLNILYLSINQEEDKENGNYGNEIFQFGANQIYDFWLSSIEEEQNQIIPFLTHNSLVAKFLVRGVSTVMEEWIKTISLLKARFIFELLTVSKGVNDEIETILKIFVTKFPPDNSNDWIGCFTLFARYFLSLDSPEPIFKKEPLFLGVFDFLYSKKFSIASKNDSNVFIELLLSKFEDQKLLTYIFSKFTMALGNKIDPSLPYFNPTKLSQCSLVFMLSFVQRIFQLNSTCPQFLKTFLNRLFSLMQIKDFKESEIFEFLLENFILYHQYLDQAKSTCQFGNLCAEILSPHSKNLTKIDLIYEHFLLVPNLFLPLDPTLGFGESIIEKTLHFIIKYIGKIQNVPLILENHIFVFLSAIFKAFLTKPAQVTKGYVMILLRKPELYIRALALLVAAQPKNTSSLLSFYCPFGNKWMINSEDLSQVCDLLSLFFGKLKDVGVSIEDSWIQAVRYVLKINSDDLIVIEGPNIINFCSNLFLLFEKKDFAMDPNKIASLCRANFDVVFPAVKRYITRWSFLNWIPLIPVILEQKRYEENRELIKQILQSAENHSENIFGELDEDISIGLFIRDVRHFGESNTIELLLSFVQGHRRLLQDIYFPTTAGHEFGIILAMSSKDFPDPLTILQLWIRACKAFSLPVHSFEEELDYLAFYDEHQAGKISNNSSLIFTGYDSNEDLFCKYTIWCLQLPLTVQEVIRQWWAQLYLVLSKYSPVLYQIVQMHSLLKNSTRKIV